MYHLKNTNKTNTCIRTTQLKKQNKNRNRILYLETLCIFLCNQISSLRQEVSTMLKFVLIIPMLFYVVFTTLAYILGMQHVV